MIIETKFNVGDVVYTFLLNKIKRAKIVAVRVSIKNGNTDIAYGFTNPQDKYLSIIISWETKCFKTKKELIDSL